MKMHDSVAGAIRTRVGRSTNRFWRPTDFDGPAGAVDAALSRLERDGELRRVRRGLYWRGTKTLLGMAPPPPDSVARELTGHVVGIGPAGASAAAALGLSTQIPARTVIATPTRKPTDTHAVRFVDRSGRGGRVIARLRPTEVAFLEILEDSVRLEASPHDVAERVGELIASGNVDPSRIVKAAASEPARIRDRVRDVFERLGRVETHAIPGRRSPRLTSIEASA